MMMIVSNDYCDDDEDGDGGALWVTVASMNDKPFSCSSCNVL
jgi:hypothetical protein